MTNGDSRQLLNHPSHTPRTRWSHTRNRCPQPESKPQIKHQQILPLPPPGRPRALPRRNICTASLQGDWESTSGDTTTQPMVTGDPAASTPIKHGPWCMWDIGRRSIAQCSAPGCTTPYSLHNTLELKLCPAPKPHDTCVLHVASISQHAVATPTELTDEAHRPLSLGLGETQ